MNGLAIMPQNSEYVAVGEMAVSDNCNDKMVTVTATCVAVVLYDPRHQVGGMLHIVLPGSRHAYRANKSETYFADTGVYLLVKKTGRKK